MAFEFKFCSAIFFSYFVIKGDRLFKKCFGKFSMPLAEFYTACRIIRAETLRIMCLPSY
jgi:hypothetical protein